MEHNDPCDPLSALPFATTGEDFKSLLEDLGGIMDATYGGLESLIARYPQILFAKQALHNMGF